VEEEKDWCELLSPEEDAETGMVEVAVR